MAAAIKESAYEGKPTDASTPRFNVITLAEPAKVDLVAFLSEEKSGAASLPRLSEVNFGYKRRQQQRLCFCDAIMHLEHPEQPTTYSSTDPAASRRCFCPLRSTFKLPLIHFVHLGVQGHLHDLRVNCGLRSSVEITPATGDAELPTAVVVSCKPLGEGCQPLLSPDDCDLAEQIVKLDAGVAKLLEKRYGITDIGERAQHAVKNGTQAIHHCAAVSRHKSAVSSAQPSSSGLRYIGGWGLERRCC